MKFISSIYNRSLRQFEWINKKISKVLGSLGIEAKRDSYSPARMKWLEGCIEAPLQLCLQLFMIVAGQWPGRYEINIKIGISIHVFDNNHD